MYELLDGDTRPVFIRGAYNYNSDLVSDETGLECKDESLADQSQKDDADINVIIARVLAGQAPNTVQPGMFGDFTEVGDYRSAVDAVRKAGEEFMLLPAKIRARFENDPQKLMEFITVESNYAEGVAIGIFKERPVPVPVPSPA